MASLQLTVRNRLLAALPPRDLDRLLDELRPVSLPKKRVLYAVGAPLDHVFFIEEGLASVLTTMEDGATSEVGMVGPEGIIGASALLGGRHSGQHIVMQLPGAARSRSSTAPVSKTPPASATRPTASASSACWTRRFFATNCNCVRRRTDRRNTSNASSSPRIPQQGRTLPCWLCKSRSRKTSRSVTGSRKSAPGSTPTTASRRPSCGPAGGSTG